MTIITHNFEFVNSLYEKLKSIGIRAEVDSRDEKLGYKIREAQTKKIPYQLVIGDKEKESGCVNVRRYGEEKQQSMSVDEFIKAIKCDIDSLGKCK